MRQRSPRTPPSPQVLTLRNGAVLALLVAAIQHLQLPEGLFLVLAVLTVLESTLGGGAIAGRERLFGSLIGLLAVVIASGAMRAAPQPLQVFSGLTLVRLFGFAAGLSSGYVVGGHMVAGSLLHDTSHWWHYAFWRTLMTMIGVLIGVWLSRHLYSQRLISRWQISSHRWLLALAQTLEHLGTAADDASVFEQLRRDRNALRLDLPSLAAEQAVLDRRSEDALLRAQLLLQHGSTVMSCSRDLAPLLGAGLPLPAWLEALPLQRLLALGSRLLRRLAEAADAAAAEDLEAMVDELIAWRARIEAPLHRSLPLLPPLEASVSDERALFIASRLLLLCDGLIQISQPGIRLPPSASASGSAS